MTLPRELNGSVAAVPLMIRCYVDAASSSSIAMPQAKAEMCRLECCITQKLSALHMRAEILSSLQELPMKVHICLKPVLFSFPFLEPSHHDVQASSKTFLFEIYLYDT